MRLVNYYITDVHHLHIGAEKSRGKPLGRDIQELEIPIGGVIQGSVHFPAVHPGVNAQGLDAPEFKIVYLVFHQGDERSDDYADSVFHQRGDLEADGFASAGGQYGKSIPPLERRRDYLLLPAAERIVAPELFQYFKRFHTLQI